MDVKIQIKIILQSSSHYIMLYRIYKLFGLFLLGYHIILGI